MDEEDAVPFSNIEETVTLDNCSSVLNQTTDSGYTMSDKFHFIKFETYRNTGQYKKAIAQLLQPWIKKGLITEDEKGYLVSCAVL